MVYLAVALGGALGAVLRWTLGDLAPDGSGFPWTTFVITATANHYFLDAAAGAVFAAVPLIFLNSRLRKGRERADPAPA